MIDYVEYCKLLVEGVCRNSPAVVVTKTIDDRGVLLTVSGVSKQDMPTVIGAKGAHATAIRELVRVAGAMAESRVSVRILDPDGTYKGPRMD